MKRSDFLRGATLAGAGSASALSLPSCSREPLPPIPEEAASRVARLARATCADLRKALDEKRLSVTGLVRERLSHIQELDRQGPSLCAVIEVNPDAMRIAEAMEREEPHGPLHGLPVLAKDNLDTQDRMCTTAGSLALEGSIAPKDSFVIERLRAAGLVLLGKTNLSEWANFRGHRSISGWSARGGQTLNPYCLDRNPSGSSSGSAAAVAAGYVPFAVGTETNGSIVSPSSCCGIVGIKPTVGLVSRAGIIPISSSQDTAGPMAGTVADAAALLAVMLGTDPRDPSTERQQGKTGAHVEALLNPRPKADARIGVARRLFQMHPLVDPVFEKALALLRDRGASFTDVELPSTSDLDRADLTVMTYEHKAGLNAYFGSLGPDSRIKRIEDLIAFNDREAGRELALFGQERLIAAATKGSLADPEYVAAKARCVEWSEKLEVLFDEHQLDAVVAPSSGPAATIDIIHGERGMHGCSTYAAVAGLPHITVPCGDVFGLPVGMSFFGRAWTEPLLVNIALAFEQSANARRVPSLMPMLIAPR